jgi:archaetidylinositol phosphate synthase
VSWTLLSRYREFLNTQFERLAARFAFLSPNTVTVISLLFSFVPAYFYYLGRLQVAAALLLVSGGLDVMDGAIARITGRVSSFGGFLDSTFDRVSDLAVLAGIALSQIVDWRVVLFTAFGSFMVPYCRARAEAAGAASMAVGIMERAERQLFLVAASLLHPMIDQVNLLEIAVGIVGLLAWITVVQRIVAARKQLGG